MYVYSARSGIMDVKLKVLLMQTFTKRIPTFSKRLYSTVKRSYLYVPSSSDRFLEKSLAVTSDVIIYDLEDSVSPANADKENARNRLHAFLRRSDIPNPERVAVRVNDVNSPFFQQDIAHIVRVFLLDAPISHISQ